MGFIVERHVDEASHGNEASHANEASHGNVSGSSGAPAVQRPGAAARRYQAVVYGKDQRMWNVSPPYQGLFSQVS